MTDSQRQTLWLFIGYWLVCSVIAYTLVEAWSANLGLVLHLAAAAVAGAAIVAVLIAGFWLCHLLLDRLPQAIRRARRTPLEKHADLVNARTPQGQRAREELMARLDLLAEMPDFPGERVYVDPATGQHWRYAYVQESWTDYYNLVPVDAEAARTLIAACETVPCRSRHSPLSSGDPVRSRP